MGRGTRATGTALTALAPPARTAPAAGTEPAAAARLALAGRTAPAAAGVLAVRTPHVCAPNPRALRRADPSSPAVARIQRVGEVLTRAFPSADGDPLPAQEPRRPSATGGREKDMPEDPADAAADLLHRIVLE